MIDVSLAITLRIITLTLLLILALHVISKDVRFALKMKETKLIVWLAMDSTIFQKLVSAHIVNKLIPTALSVLSRKDARNVMQAFFGMEAFASFAQIRWRVAVFVLT